jgi:anthranilate phosphoribosyltransferase
MLCLECGDLAVLDTCGTGGDGKGTFNISTAAAVVAAACGVPVVKHGNRGVSSASGSADVLAALGVKIDADVETVRRCLQEAGLAFCFAPRFHPAMRHVVEVRRRLRFRTIFNLMGPLANPAHAKYQLLGVSRLDLLDTLAECLGHLGVANAYLVCGEDGLDEVTLDGSTLVRHVRAGRMASLAWTPEDFGLPRRGVGELRAASAAESAQRVRAALQGQDEPAMEAVSANAAAALLAAERVASLREGVQAAQLAITEGRAERVLDRLIQISQG